MEILDDINSYFNSTEEKIKEDKEDIIIGIDLGTCNSCCSIWRNNKYEIIKDESNNNTFPSIIVFDKNDNIYSCNNAIDYINKNYSTENYFYESKRLIGRKYNDKIIDIERKYLTYEIESDDKNNIKLVKNNKTLTPEEISSYVLSSIKNSAEKYLNQEVKRAVITCPAYFNDNQRQATMDAAKIAGLECQMILCEPIASALAFGLNNIKKDNYKILIYDLGGGTLDVSLIELNNGIFEVLGTSGNMHLGGIDFDNIIYDYCISVFKSNNPMFDGKIDIEKKKELKRYCEILKKDLTYNENSIINIDDFWFGINLNINLSRTKFTQLCNKLLILCMKPINDLIEHININKEDINEIILVGGMTRVPIIQQNIKNYFNKDVNTSLNPDELVAIGAGIQGYIINYPDSEFSTSITLLNTTTLSLGIEVSNEIMDILIPKNSIIPIKEKKIYTNNESGEKSINIKIFEGERQLTKDNYLVGSFEIDVEPAPAKYHKIEISINIDINNIISVSAKNLENNNNKEIIINGKNGRLTKEQINEMIKDSIKYKLIDLQNKKYKKTQNTLKGIISNLNYNIENNNININEIQKQELNEYIKNININDNILNLKEHINTLKKSYCILLTSNINDLNGLIKKDISNSGTSIYQDENIDNEYNNNINKLNQEEDINIKNNINDIKKIVEKIIEKCNLILDYINSIEIDICCESTEILKDFVENILLWVHTENKIKLNDANEKYNLLNKTYNEYIIKTEQIELSSKEELILLCNSLKKSILAEIDIKENNLYESLNNMIYDIEEKIENDLIKNDNEYLKCIDDVNDLCELISNKI
jgi:molecular chaperone DnaK (HSP70)